MRFACLLRDDWPLALRAFALGSGLLDVREVVATGVMEETISVFSEASFVSGQDSRRPRKR